MDELNRSAAECVDVLVVIANGKDAQLVVRLRESSAGERRYEVVLVSFHVLVLIDQYPAKARKKSLPELVSLLRQTTVPLK